MLFTPRGLEARPKFKLAQLLASTAAWRAICGGVSADEAFERIYWPDVNDTEEENEEGNIVVKRVNPMPRAAIDFGEDWAIELSEGGTQIFRGSMVLSIELPAPRKVQYWPSGYWPEAFWPEAFWPVVTLSQMDRQIGFENRIGDLIDQMRQKKGTTPEADDVQDAGFAHLNVIRITRVIPPMLSDPRENLGEQYGGAAYRVEIQ
jgi:hypothetical protein